MEDKAYIIQRAIERPSNIKSNKITFETIDFSKSQIRILERIGEGLSNFDIAIDLGISRRTIETHISNIKYALANYFGYRFCDRELVIFARKMIEDYRCFVRANYDEYLKKFLLQCFENNFIDLNQDFEYYKNNYSICNIINPQLDNWASENNGH